MSKISLLGKKGSEACKSIVKNTELSFFSGEKVDALVNYGLHGGYYENLENKYKIIRKVPVINRLVGMSKFSVIKVAENKGIRVPNTTLEIPKDSSIAGWIEKRVHSSRGYGIKKATCRNKLVGKYYQKMVQNRIYELRVHSFLWIPTSKWTVFKRFGPEDQIAWNFHQGGHFQRIYDQDNKVCRYAKDTSSRILSLLNMSFGATDFIVDDKYRVYFIEVNSCPGFTNLSERIYYDAMNGLTSFTPRELKKYGV